MPGPTREINMSKFSTAILALILVAASPVAAEDKSTGPVEIKQISVYRDAVYILLENPLPAAADQGCDVSYYIVLRNEASGDYAQMYTAAYAHWLAGMPVGFGVGGCAAINSAKTGTRAYRVDLLHATN